MVGLTLAHVYPRPFFRGGTERFIFQLNVTLKRIGVDSKIYSSELSFCPDYLSDLAIATKLARRAFKDGCESVIFHKGQEAALLFPGRNAIPYFHEPKYDDLQGASVLYRHLLVSFARFSDQLLCNSKFTASRLTKYMPNAKMHIVYPGTRTLPSFPEQSAAQVDCYYHSRLHPRKNQQLLLDVFNGFSYKLYLSGGTWDRKFQAYREVLMERASHLKNVSIETDITDKAYSGLLANTSVFLFPAKAEGFGLTLLEAMEFGKPIVALDSGATSEVLAGSGMLCGADPVEWRDTITKLLTNTELRNSLSARSKARAREFSWESTAKQFVEICENWTP